ncbi:hypothetical protein MKW92_007172 [Papaver armeniacum]|nr:hypothetical protein MKW92_007172 [Papaver armeniacum]
MQTRSAAGIVFFDLETTVPNQTGRRFWVLEFGAIIVCPQKPGDLSMVSLKSGRSDGITRETVADAPMFEDVADCIFDILDGRVWAGHNIQRFDCVRIKEAFADIGRPPPVPVGMIDSLGVLSQKFGRRAGETSSRKSPPPLGIQKTVPKGRLRKVTERMTDVLCKTQGKQHIISSLLKYSHLELKRRRKLSKTSQTISNETVTKRQRLHSTKPFLRSQVGVTILSFMFLFVYIVFMCKIRLFSVIQHYIQYNTVYFGVIIRGK